MLQIELMYFNGGPVSKFKFVTQGILAISLLAQHSAWAAPVKVKRPDQFVLFAYDGSYNNEVWEEARKFSRENVDLNGKSVSHFTFFINPVYLLLKAQGLKVYKPPGKNRGSAIGWGDDYNDINKRLDNMNAAFEEGHEIGSHTVGHHDGKNWSESEWTSEFDQFNTILDKVFQFNNISHIRPLNFRDNIIGFRAPLLGVGDGLWPTLSKFGFQYDTSKVNTETYWPKKNAYGTWDFPLAEIMEPGGARKWISMDYNFCARDSARVLSEDPGVMKLTAWDSYRKKLIENNARDCLKLVPSKQKQLAKNNMLKLYRSYFTKNYYGNRAPVHIGHHFAKWMSGAYSEAFFEFAKEVCTKPEVRCGTYTDLKNFLDEKSPSEIKNYEIGNFDKIPRPKAANMERHLNLSIEMSVESEAMKFMLAGKDANLNGLQKYVSVGDMTQKIDDRVKFEDIRKATKTGDTAFVRFAVKNRLGKEIATATYQITKVGTEQESINTENIETRWMEGHLPEAHADETDQSTLGH